jgi:hypothetical protein
MILWMFTRAGQVDWSEDFPLKKESATDGRIRLTRLQDAVRRNEGG